MMHKPDHVSALNWLYRIDTNSDENNTKEMFWAIFVVQMQFLQYNTFTTHAVL